MVKAERSTSTSAGGGATAAATAPPADFDEVYGIIRELRHPDGVDHPMRGAPVDEIGCSQAADAVFAAQGEERHFHVRCV